ncbi:uncharacterized protein M421DRAFT_31668, partial [Didymella exigua CBS 183.55]
DDEGRGRVPSSADALDNCNLLVIAWLNKRRLGASLCTCDDLYRANYAYLEASLIKVVHVVIMDAILGFKYSLPILCLIKGHFELRQARYKAISPALANRLATAYSQQFISHICHLAQLGRKSSQVEVEYVLDDCLLF